jgi:hypothetical protein
VVVLYLALCLQDAKLTLYSGQHKIKIPNIMAQNYKHQRALGLVALLPYLVQAVLGDGSLHRFAPVPLTLKPVALDVACPLPVDDNAVQSSPWTHPPECEHTTDGTVKYCTYTNANHGPRGWSIITTPENAANSASFLIQQLNVSSSRDPPYKMVDIPGKGKGLVATRPIKRYEEILVEHAPMLVDIAFTVKVQATRGYRLLHAAVDRLSDPTSVRELGKSNGLAKDEVENILRTNAFNTPMDGVPHIALYPTVSVGLSMFRSLTRRGTDLRIENQPRLQSKVSL